MNMGRIIFLLLFSFLFFAASAQEMLTLQQAVEIALKNNYSITIARNESEIAKNDATIGNAGMLPQVTLNASRNFSGSDTKQEYSNGTTLDREGVTSNFTNAGILLNWTLFDGMKMFATYDKLKVLSTMGELDAKIQIENTVEQIILSYYSVVEQKQLLIANDSTIAIFSERVTITEEKWKIGSGSKSDYLQAQVDLNEQKSLRLKQKSAITIEKIKLNQLLARKSEMDFDVASEIDFIAKISPLLTTNETLAKNNTILFYDKNTLVSKYSLREFQSQRFPSLQFNTSYNFARTENQAGFFLLNQNLGYNAGLTVSWTLFNGFNTNRQVKNANLLKLNSQLTLENVKAQVSADLQAAYENYKSALEALTLEEQNIQLAKENSTIMLSLFKYGNATSLDIKTAQKSFTDALTRLVQARYDAKVAETSLQKLQGELVK